MLDKSATYHKSDRGAEALAARHGALTPRQRAMLILVDGRRGFDELARIAQVLGDPEHLLSQLAEEGYIEPGAPRAGPPSAPAPLLDSSWGQFSHPAPLDSRPAPFPARAAPLDSGAMPLDSAPVALASAPAPLGPDELQVPLAQAQRFAVERLKDLLGPEADDLCVRIEQSTTAHEFRAAVRRTETVLRSLVGPELALQFTLAVEQQRAA